MPLDAGSGTVDAVIITPVLLLLVALIIHAGVWGHAGNVARSAAHAAAEAARAYTATSADGQTAGEAMLADIGGALTGHEVTVTRTDTQVTVTVTGTALEVVPGMGWTVRAEVTAPVERLTTPETP
ncbi:TadE-like protein [Stackebrandtia endophytica]|uniref:TadE-like protein n=1 Tax=Stackebrandtia endophytica TaxID=1496996 RepID=A0A543AS03_9ACTN|nr:TadE/TadG family type IV pilus assembly protein [Stackebrandtia endophytica]TQL75363.1 TadE-like protein [Stackebrandtia endophytica]